MGFDRFLHWLNDTRFSIVMRESLWAEPLVETIHVLTLAVFLGFVILLDLRLLDVTMRRRRVSEVFQQLNPGMFGGFAVMIITGILLFVADPVSFYATTFFKATIMLALAAINVIVFNMTAGKTMMSWDEAPRTPWIVKLAGAVSLVLWVSIVASGRGIAYTLPPP